MPAQKPWRAPPLEMKSQKNELLAIARGRLYPSLTNPNYLVLRSRRIIFEKWIKQLPEQGLTVLDIGGRYQPYRPLLGARIRRYVALDVQQTEMVDVVGSADVLPFEASSFDLVIATQVFEYFRDPIRAAEQIHQALKPGGVLLMSVAAMAPRFVDEEHWRFTPMGIRATLACFAQVEIAPETRTPGGFVRTVNLGLHMFLRRRTLAENLRSDPVSAAEHSGSGRGTAQSDDQ